MANKSRMALDEFGKFDVIDFGWHQCIETFPLAVFRGTRVRFIIDDFKAEDAASIAEVCSNLVAGDSSMLDAATESVWQYYKNMEPSYLECDGKRIKREDDIWKNVQFGKSTHCEESRRQRLLCKL
jgi:hypothetical protein